MCDHYKECYKAKDSGVITSVDRWCAPGTYTDPEDIRRGAPCTSTYCDPEVCNCGIPTVSTPRIGKSINLTISRRSPSQTMRKVARGH